MLYPKKGQRCVIISYAIVVLLFTAGGYGEAHNSAVYDRLRAYIDTIKIINTHEHQGFWFEYKPKDSSFYTQLASSYLGADIVSAGAPEFEPNVIKKGNFDELWDIYGRYLDFSRNTSYYGSFQKGFQVLYGFDSPYFNKQGIASLSEKITANYANLDKWYGKAFVEAGFEIMLVDPFWNPLDVDLDAKYFALVFNIDRIVWCAAERKRMTVDKEPVIIGFDEGFLFKHNIYERSQDAGFSINSFDDYLAYADMLFQEAVDKKAVAVKNALAYVDNLDYADTPYESAKALFDKSTTSSLSDEEKKAIKDFMFHWVIKKSSEYNLPIQIHTGYLADNGNTLSNSQPLQLNKIFLKYPKVKFILFHGGYPWTGEFIALGKMFPNVYLDLVWLPQISRSAAIRTLDEMLDTVPYNKFFWGGDCVTIELSVGSLEYGKEVVAEVLATRVEKGLMTEKLARDVALKIFRENALHFFKLEERLNRVHPEQLESETESFRSAATKPGTSRKKPRSGEQN